MALLAAGLAAAPVLAAASPRGIRPEALGYSVRLWTVEDGIPADFISSLAQGSDGYLWWPNNWGLARFDGVRLRTFLLGDDPAPPQRLLLACPDPRGRIRAAGDTGLGLVEDDQVRWWPSWELPDSLRALFADVTGEGWMGARCASETVIFRLGPAWSSVLEEYRVDRPGSSLAVDGRGAIWLSTDDGLVEVVRHEGSKAGEVRRVDLGEPRTSDLFRHRDASIGVIGSGGRYALVEGTWRKIHHFAAPVEATSMLGRVASDGQDQCWFGTRLEGLWVSLPDGRTVPVELPGLLLGEGFGIGAVLCDREDNIWVGTRHGLYQLQRVPFRPGLEADALAHTEPVDVGFDAEGATWVLAESGSVVRFSPDGSPRELPAQRSDGRFLEVDETGTVWLASDTAVWCLRDSPAGEAVSFASAGLVTGQLVSLAAAAGAVWIGTDDRGLWQLQEGRLQPVDLPVPNARTGSVEIAINAAGETRVRVEGGGFCRLTPDGWQPMSSGNRAEGPVVGVHVDPEGRTWMYGGKPMLCHETGGRWVDVALARTGVPVEVIAVDSDNLGGLWALTKSDGVVRVERDPESRESTEPEWFGVGDGLPSIAGRGWGKGVSRGPDGRMWFTTSRGIAVIDPRSWRASKEASLPPKTHLERVLVNGQPRDWRADAPVRMPSRGGRIEIQYTGIGLRNAVRNRFRYRIEGLDDGGWSEAGSSRSAVFRNLPPGEHVFHVVAANSDGVWDRQGARLALLVLPAWWQTWWLRSGVALGGAALLWSLRAGKLRQVARERSRQEEFTRRLIESQEAERKRIAAELHDSLGQNLLIARNHLFLAGDATTDAALQSRLRKVGDSVAAAIEEARNISHQLRPFQLERLGLTKAIASVIRQTSESTRLPVKTQIENVDGLLPPTAEVMVYRLVQEGLNNVVKHADASEVRVRIQRAADRMRLVIEDDGRGFDAARMQRGEAVSPGLGLTGFEERTKLLRGRFRCLSVPGRGTVLTFEIPVSHASNEGAEDSSDSGR